MIKKLYIELDMEKGFFIINKIKNPRISIFKSTEYELNFKNVENSVNIIDKSRTIFVYNINNSSKKFTFNTNNINGDLFYIQTEDGMIRSKFKLI